MSWREMAVSFPVQGIGELLQWLEDHSLELVDQWLAENKGGDFGGQREAFYAFLLYVIKVLGTVTKVATLRGEGNEDIKQIFFRAACFLVDAIEKRSVHTVGHSQRVAVLAGKMAALLGLPDEEVADIEYAARIHNLGMINDVHRLHLQPRPLTEAERQRARHHALVGAEMLRPIEFLAPIVPIILYHHTWYDGSGFPGGLRGEEIPLGARIIHLCDAFVAMTSHRPYRPAKTTEEALAEIDRLAGKQFDPKLVPIVHTLAQGGIGHGSSEYR